MARLTLPKGLRGRSVAAARCPPDEAAMGAIITETLRPEIAEDLGPILQGMAEHHPHEPHWYLPLIAADSIRWSGSCDGAAGIRSAVPLSVGLGVDDPAWDPVFSKNATHSEGAIAAKFLAAVLAQPKVKKLLSDDHFSVDGTLIEAWASMKSSGRRTALASCRHKAAGAMPKRTSTAKNVRTTAMLRPPIPMPGSSARVKARKRSCASSGHGPTENRHGLFVDACLMKIDCIPQVVAGMQGESRPNAVGPQSQPCQRETDRDRRQRERRQPEPGRHIGVPVDDRSDRVVPGTPRSCRTPAPHR